MTTLQDPETKIKMLEMNVARLERNVTVAEEELEEIKRFLVKLVSHQTALAEKLRLWPYVLVDKSDQPDSGKGKK